MTSQQEAGESENGLVKSEREYAQIAQAVFHEC
jgi:hypothetical protein